MSIQENLNDFKKNIQALMMSMPYELREEDRLINSFTQQIISEIVGELEKLKEKYIPEGFTVLGIDECIETIKKMGEV